METTNLEVSPETETPLEITLTSDCLCEDYDEETGESQPSSECWNCYDDQKDYLLEVIETWATANEWQMNTPILIKGNRMTWRGLSGWAEATPETLIEKLTLDADFTLRFTLSPDSKRLTCVRSSHDEYGAFFEFEKSPEVAESDSEGDE